MMLFIDRNPKKVTTGFITAFVALVTFQITFAVLYGSSGSSDLSINSVLISADSADEFLNGSSVSLKYGQVNLQKSVTEDFPAILQPDHGQSKESGASIISKFATFNKY